MLTVPDLTQRARRHRGVLRRIRLNHAAQEALLAIMMFIRAFLYRPFTRFAKTGSTSKYQFVTKYFRVCNLTPRCLALFSSLLFSYLLFSSIPVFAVRAENDDAGDETVTITIEEAVEKLESSGIEVRAVLNPPPEP